MGYGSFSLVRKCAAQNESEKKKSFYFPELYDDETAKNEKKKKSGKTGPVGATQWKNG